MRTYEIELKRTSYIIVHVDAENKDQAEDLRETCDCKRLIAFGEIPAKKI